MAKDRIRLDELDQSKSLDQDEYKKLLKKNQLELLNAQLVLRESKKSLIIVLEGPDAAGKGGAIKRVTERLDPRLVRVYSIVKPTPEEFQHHYMWRFWSKLPPHGQITIFDRSWYGQLADDGAIILKFYLHITKDEQLDRFKRREADPYKHWKISDEDWRNRNHWDQHNEAAEDLFEKTSVDHAPWIVIPANYKWFARVKVVKTVAERVAKTLKT